MTKLKQEDKKILEQAYQFKDFMQEITQRQIDELQKKERRGSAPCIYQHLNIDRKFLSNLGGDDNFNTA